MGPQKPCGVLGTHTGDWSPMVKMGNYRICNLLCPVNCHDSRSVAWRLRLVSVTGGLRIFPAGIATDVDLGGKGPGEDRRFVRSTPGSITLAR
jgi:hypothetical protein